MLSLRYNPGKIWANFAIAMAAGIVVVILLATLFDRGVRAGGVGAVIGIGLMLFVGCVKRTSMREPILVVDRRGITIGLAKYGTIPWDSIRSATVKGIPWVTGARLAIETTGPLPKSTFGEKIGWLIHTKQNKDGTGRLALAAVELLDRPLAELEAALAARGA